MKAANLHRKLLGTVQFQQWSCEVFLSRYDNGRHKLLLIDADDFEPVACATINLPGVDLSANELVVKDYGENQGMLEALVAGGIVAPTGRAVPIGYGTGQVCVLVDGCGPG